MIRLFGVSSLPCRDWEGNIVSNGDEYTPDKDEPCRSCMCQNGLHIMCNMVLCSPPACMKIKTVENACCDFRCLNGGPENTHSNRTGDKNGIGNVKRRSDDDIADQGLRLAASTVTSFLVLALLLFMVHRLCQRRHLIQMRRLNAPRNHQDDDNDNNPFSQDAFSIGMPCPPPYEGPPPPYTLPKPFTYIQPCEAPPPYEEVQYQMAGHNPAFSDTLSPTNRTINPNDTSGQEAESNPSMHGLNLEGVSCEFPSNVDNDDDSSLHETTPKTPFGTDENQFTSPFTRTGHSPSIARPFSTFFGSCTSAEISDGRQARNSCGSIAARAERIRSCLFPSGKEHQDGIALGLTRQQAAAAAISLRETGEKSSVTAASTSTSKADKFAPWYIKRSESIEIRRESHSPRNSYCFRNNYIPSDTSDSSESEQESADVSSSWLKSSNSAVGFSLGTNNQQPQQSTAAGSAVSSFKPSVSKSSDCYTGWEKQPAHENLTGDCVNESKSTANAEVTKSAVPGKPVRISYIDSPNQQSVSHGTSSNKTDVVSEQGEKSNISKLNSANQLANSSFVQSHDFGVTSSALQIRNSLPPLELKPLQPDLQKSEMATQTSKITPPSVLSLTSGASGSGLLSVEHAEDSLSERGFRDLHHPATILSGRLQSPGTPVSSGSSPSRNSMGTLQDRSNSLTSDISLFSICSETGEKKRPKNNSSSCTSTPSTITSSNTIEATHNAGNSHLIKNENPYADPFHTKTIKDGGDSGNITNMVNPVTAGATHLPIQRHEPLTTASLVSNILKRYSDIPRQSVEHDENSYSKPSSSAPPTSLPPSTSTSSSLIAQHQHFKPQSSHIHTSSASSSSAHHQANSHIPHHSHHSSWSCDPSSITTAVNSATGRLIKRSDCTLAQSYPRKSEIRSLDNRKSIDDIIRTIDITPVLQSIAKPLDILRDSTHLGSASGSKELAPTFSSGATSRTNSSSTTSKTMTATNVTNSSLTNFSKFGPLNASPKDCLSSSFPFTDKTSPPPPLPVYPKPKASPADRKKRHSLGSMSKASKRSGHKSANHQENTNCKSASTTSSSLLNSIQNSFNMSTTQAMKSSDSSQTHDSNSHSNANKICEPCYKQYGYVERLTASHSCGHKKEHGKSVTDHFKDRNAEKEGESNKLSPSMMKYLTASPKSSNTGQLSYPTDNAHSTVKLNGAGAGQNSSSSGYKVKKMSHPRISPDHKTKSSSSATHKSTSGSSCTTTASVEVHQPPSGVIPKKRHARSKDKNRKSYPGASPDTTPRETKIVSSPWMAPSSSSASSASRKPEKSHRSNKHGNSSSVALDLSRNYTNEGNSSTNQTSRHGNSVQNHMSQLSSYV
ncbi:serine-rich adhesin for platelets-like [Octopus sinensis]|uniref:Serine-rich adhesin for platelets-like n=1 Tax=Octopus sinensis TaxID=2607531 RepID=A0A7E6EJD4_9MOLL|nr:serine-rich adhesin for platelets-like [Octopus sinensis]